MSEKKETFATAAAKLALADLLELRSVLGNKIAELEATIAPSVKKLNERIELVEQLVQAQMNQSGAQTFTSPNGLNVHWRENRKVSLGDPLAYWECLAAQLKAGVPVANVFAALQKRPTQEFVDNWIERHNGAPPPGVNVFPERKLIFSRR